MRENSRTSQAGMSLVEVLVSVGLLSLLAISTTSIVALLGKSTEYGDRSQSIMSLTNLIRQHTSFSDLCDASLGGSSTHNNGNFNLADPKLEIRLPNIGSGPTMNLDYIGRNIDVLPYRLHIDDLRLGDLRNIGGTQYVGQIYLDVSGLDGFKYKPILVSSVKLDITGASPNMTISTCFGIDSRVSKAVCTNMGCAWDDLATPNCQCLQPNGICPVGELPIAIKNGVSDCRPLGGKACGPNEYLVGVGIESTTCAPVY